MATSMAANSSSAPKPGDNVSVTLQNKEVVQGIVEWVDGNGAWVKGTQKSRWIPIEYFLHPELQQPKAGSPTSKKKSDDEGSEE